MPDNTTESPALTLTKRIMQAGGEIVNLHTGLPLELCSRLVDKSVRLASQEFGVVPFAAKHLNASEKLALAQRSIELISKALMSHGVAAAAAQDVLNDLNTFYRGVRGIAPAASS